MASLQLRLGLGSNDNNVKKRVVIVIRAYGCIKRYCIWLVKRFFFTIKVSGDGVWESQYPREFL